MANPAVSLVDDGRDCAPLLMQTLLDRGAKVQPENRILTKTSSGYSAMTFYQYQSRVSQLGHALSVWGARPGDCVGTLMWNNVWHLQCCHAIGCIGAVVHTLNARLSARDITFILQDARDRLVFVDGILLELLGKVEKDTLALVDQFVCCGADGVPSAWTLPQTLVTAKTIDLERFLASGSDRFGWPDFPETTPYYLCYTSGSTSAPKGVIYSHRSMYLAVMTMGLTDQYGISGSMVVCPYVPMFHIFSWGAPLVTLMLGAKTVFTNQYTSSDDFLDTLQDCEVEWTEGVPPVWQMLRETIKRRGVDVVRPKLRLSKVLSGGSAPSAEVLNWYHATLGIEFMQGWGMTETNPLGTNARYVNTYRDRIKSKAEQYSNLERAGVPVPGFEFRIANANDLDKDMPQGQAGELLVRGTLVITKYFKQATPDKFHRGWLITGDIALIDKSGEIVICDRKKDFIKSGGEWISSLELEKSIASIDGISLVAVIGVRHPKWDERPIAVITLRAGASVEKRLAESSRWTVEEAPSQTGPHVVASSHNADENRAVLTELVRAHLTETFAKFQLPDDVLVWESMPLNSMGKVDKKRIREQLQHEGYILPGLRSPKPRL